MVKKDESSFLSFGPALPCPYVFAPWPGQASSTLSEIFSSCHDIIFDLSRWHHTESFKNLNRIVWRKNRGASLAIFLMWPLDLRACRLGSSCLYKGPARGLLFPSASSHLPRAWPSTAASTGALRHRSSMPPSEAPRRFLQQYCRRVGGWTSSSPLPSRSVSNPKCSHHCSFLLVRRSSYPLLKNRSKLSKLCIRKLRWVVEHCSRIWKNFIAPQLHLVRSVCSTSSCF